MSGSSFVATASSRPVFTVGANVFAIRDILDAGMFRGELLPVWTELMRLRACESRAEDEEREADEAAVDEAVQTFRYDHDLITAEETEQWLADRGLTLSDFGDYFDRGYWGGVMSDVTAETIDLFSAPAELREMLHGELMLSGELGRMANRLACRLAVAQAKTEPPGLAAVAAARTAFLERFDLEEKDLPGWLAKLDRSESWLDEMLQLEAGFESEREALLTPDALKRELRSLRFELTVFDVEIIELDSRDAAAEALLCVREDGMAMEEVAAEGRYPFHREQLLLEDIPPEVQQQFLSVIPGRVLEPMELGGAHRLCRVVAKKEPDPDSTDVRERVEKRLLDRHFADAVSQHLHWDLWLS